MRRLSFPAFLLVATLCGCTNRGHAIAGFATIPSAKTPDIAIQSADSESVMRALVLAKQQIVKMLAFPSRPAIGQVVDLPLFADADYSVRVTKADDKAEPFTAVTATIDAKFYGRALLLVRGDEISGNVNVDGRTFSIVPLGKGNHRIMEVDPVQFPPEAEPFDFESPRSTGISLFSTDDDLRILVVFTADRAGDCADDTLINLYKLQVETAFSSVGIAQKVSVVSFCPEGLLSEGKDLKQDLVWLQSSAAVADKRDEVDADLVVMIVTKGDFCGRGNYIKPPLSSGSSAGAFSVVYDICALDNYSFVHEIGHNVGLQHDRATKGGGIKDECNYGFVGKTGLIGWRTIMAGGKLCEQSAGGCNRIPVFSNPLANPRTGIPCSVRLTGASGSANNAEELAKSVLVARQFFP